MVLLNSMQAGFWSPPITEPKPYQRNCARQKAAVCQGSISAGLKVTAWWDTIKASQTARAANNCKGAW